MVLDRGRARAQVPDGLSLARQTLDFIVRCGRADGGYAPSPDPAYAGESDTKFSDLAAVTYAAVLARTMGWELPRKERSIAFIRGHQRPDGRFVNLAGKHDPASGLGILYNTTQGVVGLRALGAEPEIDPIPSVEQLLAGDAYRKLPWYTTSFFPLLCAALGKPFPRDWRDKLAAAHGAEARPATVTWAITSPRPSTWLTFIRLIGEPTPRAEAMVARVLRDQKPDGGWNIKEPDWDVHSCFDAVFILRQLGGNEPKVKQAIARGADWSLELSQPGRRLRPLPRPAFRHGRRVLPVWHTDPGRTGSGSPARSARCPDPRLGPCDGARQAVSEWLLPSRVRARVHRT